MQKDGEKSSPMVISYIDIDLLVPYENNPRINDHVVDAMVDTLEEFGFRIPILTLSSGQIIDGHLRYKAAKKIGLKNIPVIHCDDWSEAQIKAFRILVNRSATWAEWDNAKLGEEFVLLQSLDYDLKWTGFSENERDLILNGWDSDVEAVKKINENEDGIDATIKITCPQETKDEFKEWLVSIIASSGYENVKFP